MSIRMLFSLLLVVGLAPCVQAMDKLELVEQVKSSRQIGSKLTILKEALDEDQDIYQCDYNNFVKRLETVRSLNSISSSSQRLPRRRNDPKKHVYSQKRTALNEMIDAIIADYLACERPSDDVESDSSSDGEVNEALLRTSGLWEAVFGAEDEESDYVENDSSISEDEENENEVVDQIDDFYYNDIQLPDPITEQVIEQAERAPYSDADSVLSLDDVLRAIQEQDEKEAQEVLKREKEAFELGDTVLTIEKAFEEIEEKEYQAALEKQQQEEQEAALELERYQKEQALKEQALKRQQELQRKKAKEVKDDTVVSIENIIESFDSIDAASNIVSDEEEDDALDCDESNEEVECVVNHDKLLRKHLDDADKYYLVWSDKLMMSSVLKAISHLSMATDQERDDLSRELRLRLANQPQGSFYAICDEIRQFVMVLRNKYNIPSNPKFSLSQEDIDKRDVSVVGRTINSVQKTASSVWNGFKSWWS